MNLALFDFDGTITHADMYTKFLQFSASKRRSIIGSMVLFPFALSYRLGLLPAHKMRPIASFVAFTGKNFDSVNSLGAQFSRDVIPNFLRENALERILWHQENGDEVVVVSASLDIYLRHWCEELGLKLICSELEIENNTLSGRYISGDCSCEAKSNKVNAIFDLSKYPRIYAYGDTPEDNAMLALATNKYMNWVRVEE